MGLREWRECQVAKADALVARADARREGIKAHEAAASEARKREQQETLLGLMRARAREWGDDHDALMVRAAAVGMGSPVPSGGMTRFARAMECATRSPGDGESLDPYRAWRNRIVIEEMVAAKIARGEPLTRRDRAVLRTARFSSES